MLAPLEELLDKQAIHELLLLVARGVDRYDQTLLARCILADAVLDMGGASMMTGEAFVAALSPPANPRPGRMHVIANALIRIEGDAAGSETYVMSFQDIARDGMGFTRTRAGRYLDRFARTADGWRLSARTMVDEWGRMDPVVETIAQGRHHGRPMPDDLSYRTWGSEA